MAESRISYLDRTFEDYKNDIIDISQKYYPDIFNNYNDASIGNWLIDVQADIADNLSYNIDRTYQETNIDSANTKDAILNIARTNGLKISGPKCAIVEIELSCKIPMNNSSAGNSGNNLAKADENYCPYVRRGTLFSDGLTLLNLLRMLISRASMIQTGFQTGCGILTETETGISLVTHTRNVP